VKGYSAEGSSWRTIERPRARLMALVGGCLAALATVLCWWVHPAVSQARPPTLTLLSPPTVSGTAAIGKTLTENHAVWNVTPFAFAYQWEDCDSSGQHCASIGNASKPSYTVTASDAGHTLRIEETVFTWLGAGQALSAVTAMVPNPPSPPPVSVPRVSTTTSLMSLESRAVSDQVVTLIATVTSSSSAVPPSGALTFEDGGTPIGGCQNEPVLPTGQSVTVTCQTSFGAATAQLSAAFTPTAGSVTVASTSAPESFSIRSAPTTTSVGTSSRSVRPHAATTYTATVRPSYLGPLTPSQTVAFVDNGEPIPGCAGQPLDWSGAAGVAYCKVSYTRPGRHLITAAYAGDANFAASTSSTGALLDVVAGRVNPSLSWTFFYTPAYTKVLVLMVGHVLRGARVRVTCTGRGCPRISRAVAVRHSTLRADGVDLITLFRDRRLRPGTVIAVTVERRGWIGKRYAFRVRAGRAPRLTITCQVPGMAPGAGC
jgi:hypothetical protein